MNDFFQFEADFVDNLRCIPMQVRYKLDTCGVKLKLSHWTQFSATERQALVEKPCVSDPEIVTYCNFLQQLVKQHTGSLAGKIDIESHPAWLDDTQIPTSLQEKAQAVGTVLTLQHWVKLTPLQRFALIKLSRPSHENQNFVPALQEFHLL